MINIRDFPKSSGVYIFKSNDEIIYIGSSKNLYHRMKVHNAFIRKGSKSKQNPALYKFLHTNTFTVEFKLTDDYRKLEQKLIEQYNPIYNSIRANTGLGARKCREAEYMKEYRKTYREEILEEKKQYYVSHRKEILEKKKQYNNQLCSYNGKTLSLDALRKRFRRQGIPHSTIEAKKYLIGDNIWAGRNLSFFI